MFLWLLRAFYILILAGTAATIVSEHSSLISLENGGIAPNLFFFGILALGVGVIVVDVLSPRKRIADISSVYFGLLVGNLLAYAVYLAFEPIVSTWANKALVGPFSLLTSIILCYICVSVLLQTQKDFRLIIPYVEFSRQLKGARSMILDTSVIIDGRIADIADTGLIDQPIVVPRIVLEELQRVADSSDADRRKRGRRGLDVLDRLKACPSIELEFHESRSEPESSDDWEARLVRIAKDLGGKLVTTDQGLLKLARLHEVPAINLNDVSAAARPPVLTGDRIAIELIREGEEQGQGIGFLDDGTMVVAEMGKRFVGTRVNLIVTKVLQTSGGRLVFGRIDNKSPDPARS